VQTFLPLPNPKDTAKILDRNRLGKQRVECVQIARTLFNISEGWKTHPAVKMWKGYESYLVKVYFYEIMNEWIERGYKNEKCEEHYNVFLNIIGNSTIVEPNWINDDFCKSHQSNLVRKKPEYYRKFFPDVPDNLKYVWPV
jgi:hypothetical protein